MRRVAIMGLGMIGGSLARDLAAAGVRISGYDRDAAAVGAARDAGVLDHPMSDPHDLADVDAVVLAVPVRAAPALLGRLPPDVAGARVIMDVGGTKRSIVAAAQALGLDDRFVGAHPMAGHHEAGWGASRRGLFRDARVYLTPIAGTSAAALESAETLWRLVGARTERIDAALHDHRVARTSHLPQLVATALARALAAEGVSRAELATGGRDMTRLAASDPELWRDIVVDNADEVTAALDALVSCLLELRDAIERGDAMAADRIFSEARVWARPVSTR